MQNDETIWSCCGRSFCAFKVKFGETSLCKNVYNVTGACSKATCPLANSYYGTIIEENGECYLYLKTIERAHTPRKLWEKIKLSPDNDKAISQIEEHMLNVYKNPQIQKCKERLVKIREYLQRMRRLALKEAPIVAYESAKTRRREEGRELKALKAAKITDVVEQELLARLKAGHYGEIYNYSQEAFDKVMEREGVSEDEEEEVETGEEDLAASDEEMIPDLEDLIEENI